MEFACHTWAFNDLSLTEALGTIARMGFRFVDIGTGPHIDVAQVARDPRGAAAEIRADLAAFNLKLSDVYVMLPGISLADEARRRKSIDLFRALLPFLVALEAPGVTLSPGMRQPETDQDAQDRTVAALRDMVKAARAATPATQMRVSIEPHLDSMAATPQAALKLIEQVEGLALTLDWAHMVCQDVFHAEIVRLLPHVKHVQMRQAARAHLQVPFERGTIDVPEVVAALQEAGYTGVVSVEIMQAEGWHGMEKVNAVRECSRMRDALRDARDA